MYYVHLVPNRLGEKKVRNCTLLHLVKRSRSPLRNRQITGVKVEGIFRPTRTMSNSSLEQLGSTRLRAACHAGQQPLTSRRRVLCHVQAKRHTGPSTRMSTFRPAATQGYLENAHTPARAILSMALTTRATTQEPISKSLERPLLGRGETCLLVLLVFGAALCSCFALVASVVLFSVCAVSVPAFWGVFFWAPTR